MKVYSYLNRPVTLGEENTDKSMTFPDMSLSLKQLVAQYRMGTLPLELVRDVLYDDCDDFDSVLAEYAPAYDLVDKQRELSKLRQKFEAMHNVPSSVAKQPKSPDTDPQPSATDPSATDPSATA